MTPRKKKPVEPVEEPYSEEPETVTEPETVVSAVNYGSNGLLTAGDVVDIVADILPARITPKPDGLPAGISKMRAIITNKTLTIAWPGGFQNGVPVVNRYDVLLTDEASNASFQGGELVAADGVVYTVVRGTGCACGASGVKTWHPFPGVTMNQRPRSGVVQVSTNQSRSGQVRYSRA